MLVNAHRIALRVLLAALTLTLTLPLAALSADQLAVKSDSDFRLFPGQDRVKANINVSLTNRAAPTYSIGPCTPGSSQRCRFTRTYYYDKFRYIFVPVGATNVKFSPGVKPRLHKDTKHWKEYEVGFPNLNYGQTRKFKVTYELPGAKPRSKHHTRVMDAYTYFCWHGEPADSGSVTAQLPPGYEATTFYGKTRTKSNKKGTTITGTFKGSPGKFYACTDAFKPSKLLRTDVTSPSGQQVTIEGWPEDPEWSETMVEAIETTLPELEDLIGRPMPLDEVVIREVTEQSLDGYASEFGVRRALIRLGDHIDDPASAPRGLAMAWFNDRRVKDTWLQMGLSDWAGNEVGAYGCWPEGEYPGKGQPKLSKWKRLQEKPSEKQEAIHIWQYHAACNLIEDMADRVGEERMHAVIAALLDGTPKYGPEPTERSSKSKKPATWKDWLDAIDEVGLVPAGETDLTLAEQDLKDAGVATGKQLKGRAKARTAYHDALAGMDGTHMPRLITNAMGKWDFKAAIGALPVAAAAYGEIMANDGMGDADRAAFLADFESAKSLKGLRNLKQKATAFEPTSVEPAEPETE
ncbi:MAG: hypothetical protein U9O18_08220 [Chloroflexota bacterium]|nr:hypothetical protein [Chloroflexota bacterium]